MDSGGQGQPRICSHYTQQGWPRCSWLKGHQAQRQALAVHWKPNTGTSGGDNVRWEEDTEDRMEGPSVTLRARVPDGDNDRTQGRSPGPITQAF